VLASIYNSMSARRRDLAILRALGARRRTIFGAVLAEAACIGALGAAAGFAVYFGAVRRRGPDHPGADRGGADAGVAHPVLWICPLAMVAMCALGGIVPALKAYRTPVAETLAPLS
jgi:putative ABC transport system permease protein